MEKHFNYIYVITNLVNNKKYIGDHSTNCLDDGYLGSGKPLFENAKRKYGRKNFSKEILEFFNTKQKAFSAQEKFIYEYNTLAPNGYNLSPTGGLRVSGCHSKETIEKIRNGNLGQKRSKETKEKLSESHTGLIQPHSDRTKEKLSIALKGKNVGKKRTEKFKENLRGLNVGKKHSKETKHKMQKNHTKCWEGKKFSEDHKEKIRLAALKRWSK
jgi:hypothetical protein